MACHFSGKHQFSGSRNQKKMKTFVCVLAILAIGHAAPVLPEEESVESRAIGDNALSQNAGAGLINIQFQKVNNAQEQTTNNNAVANVNLPSNTVAVPVSPAIAGFGQGAGGGFPGATQFPQGGAGFPQGGAGFPQGGAGFPQGGAGFPQGGAGFNQGGAGFNQGGAGFGQNGMGFVPGMNAGNFGSGGFGTMGYPGFGSMQGGFVPAHNGHHGFRPFRPIRPHSGALFQHFGML